MTVCTFRTAVPGDEELILSFIRALADYEHMSDQVVATPERGGPAKETCPYHGGTWVRAAGMGLPGLEYPFYELLYPKDVRHSHGRVDHLPPDR